MRLVKNRPQKIGQTVSRSIFDALKSLYITSFSAECKKAKPLAAPIVILILFSQERGSMEERPDHHRNQRLAQTIMNDQISLILHLRKSYFQRDGFPSFPWARIHTQEAILDPPSRNPIIWQDLDDLAVLKSSLLPALYHMSSKTLLDLAKWTLIEKIHLQNNLHASAEQLIAFMGIEYTRPLRFSVNVFLSFMSRNKWPYIWKSANF